jgi:GR25 family glycosyltransferase involved in LPS biosynthesis
VGHSAFVITLEGHEYSEAKATRCIESAAEFGIKAEKFKAIDQDQAFQSMAEHGLRWTWANGNISNSTCPITGLAQHPYGDLASKIGCSMSHYLLWQHCVNTQEPILILEHDAVFLRALPEIEFKGVCMINDPAGATHRGEWWSEHMTRRGTGVFSKTMVMSGKRPDGLAGNSAYLIKPHAAQELISAFHALGVWPNDATACIQLFPYLQELFPFVTRVEQTQSTTGA